MPSRWSDVCRSRHPRRCLWPRAIVQLCWRRQKASCVIGISGPINSTRSGPRYGTMLTSHPHPKISRNRLRVDCVDKFQFAGARSSPPCLPARFGIHCDRERRVARHLRQIEHPANGHSDPNRPGAFHTRIPRSPLRDLSCERPASRERRLKSFMRPIFSTAMHTCVV